MLSIALRTFSRQLLRFVAVLMVSLMAFGSTAMAQTTGQLKGRVIDAEDQTPIPSVQITIISPNLIGGKQESQTDGDGYYQFIALLPGLYTITYVKGGYGNLTAEDVQVNINSVTTRNVSMVFGATEEEVLVETRQTVNTESTTVGQVLTKDFLQSIPTGRSYQQAVQVTAGVSGGSNPNIGGGASNENTYLLDGATVTDPVSGTFGTNFNFDAIEQIEVLTAGFEPEYGTSLGGIINIVTQSGTNNLEFDTSVYYLNGNWRPRKDERWTSDGYQLGPTGFDQTFGILQIAAQVSGPLVRDKAWFLFSYQYVWNRQANAGVLQPLDIQGHQLLGKLTIQPNSSHRISLLFQTDPATFDNLSQQGPFQKAEAQGRQAQGGFVAQARWQWFLNEDLNLDTRISTQKIGFAITGVPCTHNRERNEHPCAPDEQEGNVDYFTPGRGGILGAYDSVNFTQFSLEDRWRFSASSKLSILEVVDPLDGRHDFKIGIEGNQFVNNTMFGFTGNTTYVDANLASFDPETLINYYWYESTGSLLQRQTGSTWNFFLQDFYKPISNLVIKYGFRFDSSVYRNDVGDPIVGGNLWGPRFFAAWDPANDQKTKIVAGYGRFNDSGRQSVASFTNVQSFGFKFYLGGINNTYTSQQSLLANVQPRENPNQVNEQLRLPSIDQFLFKFQRQLVPDLSAGVDFTANFTRHLYDFDETSIVYDSDGSAVIGSRRANPLIQYARLRTPREARRNYYRLDVYLDKVFARRWGGRATYSYAFINGTTNRSLAGTFSNAPQTQYNYGQLLTARTHAVNAYGFWRLPTDPWTITLGFSLDYESGQPLERTYWTDNAVTSGGFGLRVRQRGVYYYFNDIWQAGLRYIQQFDLRKGTLALDVTLINVFNNRAPDSLSALLYQTNRLFILSRQQPLTLQLGLRYQF